MARPSELLKVLCCGVEWHKLEMDKVAKNGADRCFPKHCAVRRDWGLTDLSRRLTGKWIALRNTGRVTDTAVLPTYFGAGTTASIDSTTCLSISRLST